MSLFSRTDLACELPKNASDKGILHREYERNGFRIEETEQLPENGNPCRERYTALHMGRIWEADRQTFTQASKTAAAILLSYLSSAESNLSSEDGCVLVAGLGNRFITADSVGPRTADLVTVTNHAVTEGTLPALLGCRRVCALAPGVLGQTGLEAAQLIADAVQSSGAEAVIAVDALAARSTERLGTTLQISSAGIRPGSGIGNHRAALTRETLGVPVIAMGVPTVVDCATLLEDAMHRAHIRTPDEHWENALRQGREFIVSPRETDLIVSSAAELLADTLNRTLNPLLIRE